MPEPAGASLVFAGAVTKLSTEHSGEASIRRAQTFRDSSAYPALWIQPKGGNGMGDLQKLFNPATIAVIGATDKEGTFGRAVLENALNSGNRTVYPVNPNRDTVLGHPCWSAIGAVPGPVDLAIVVTPAATVPGIVDACGKAGVEGLIIISSGFRETGEEGRRLEEEIIRINAAYGIRIIGPNCLGIIRPTVGLNASFLRENPEGGNIAFVADMGNFGRTLLDWGFSAHIGFSMVVSLGSAIDVGFGDVVDFLAEDPHTKSIILYMEEVVGNVKLFVSAVRGFARNKPVILLKPPALEDGDRTGLTHSGMMAGPDKVYDAVFRRLGVVRVREANDLFDAASALYARNRPRGARLAIMTNAAQLAFLHLGHGKFHRSLGARRLHRERIVGLMALHALACAKSCIMSLSVEHNLSLFTAREGKSLGRRKSGSNKS